ISLFVPALLFAQIDFIKVPSNMQMFPRDSSNVGHFAIIGFSSESGKVSSSVYNAQSGEIHEQISISVSATASFEIQHTVPAKLAEFDLHIRFTSENGQEKLIKTVKGLLAGDFFIVAGQSNAEGPGIKGSDKHDSAYAHFATRTIGTNFAWATTTIDSAGFVD